MELRIVSDLHLDHHNIDLPTGENELKQTLILAGDICTNINKLYDFLNDCSYRFKNTILIYGNHEYYGHNVLSVKARFQDLVSKFANVHLLDNELIELDGITFFGGTLWGDGYRTPHYGLNDFNVVRFPEDFYYNEYLEFIHKFDAVAEQIDVVISHHSPSYKSLDPRFAGSSLNPYFMNSLEQLFDWGTNMQYWIHGHTHSTNQYKIKKCKVVCNPKGYFDENPEYNPLLTVEVNKMK